MISDRVGFKQKSAITRTSLPLDALFPLSPCVQEEKTHPEANKMKAQRMTLWLDTQFIGTIPDLSFLMSIDAEGRFRLQLEE
jgi:hypothetical protein